MNAATPQTMKRFVSLSLRVLLSASGIFGIAFFGQLDCLDSKRVAAAELQITPADVVSVWRKRESSVATCRVRWDESRSYAPDSLVSKIVLNSAHGIPAEKLHVEFPCELLMKGEFLRYTARSARVERDLSVSFVPYVSSYDGTDSRMLSKVSESQYHGVQNKEERNTDAPSYPLKPLLLAFTPDSAAFGSESFKVVGFDAELASDDSQPLLQLASSTYRVWCDVGKRMQITRWQSVRPDQQVQLQVDLTYEKDESIGWKPSLWELQRFRKGSTSEKYVGIVTSCEIGLQLTKADFRLDFPAGTRGYDQTDKTDFAILADGKKRLLSQNELSLSTNELDEIAKSGRGWGRFVWLLNFLGLFGVSGFVMAKTLKRRNRAKP